jgi:hypothetical protein
MKRNIIRLFYSLIVAFSIFALTGCVEVIGAVGTGALMGAEYIVTGAVSKTISYEFVRIKKALLVALCRMEILVDKAREIEDGEEIIATADELEIRIELKQITPTVTRISVRAEKGFMNRDKATAQEIVSQTNNIAERLVSYSGVAQSTAQV